jgi:hypothetical protein
VDPLEQGGRSPGSARCPRRLPESIDAAIGAALTDLQSGSKRSLLVQARLLPAEIPGAGRRGIANRKERPRQRLSPSAFEPPPQVLDACFSCTFKSLRWAAVRSSIPLSTP